MRDSPRFGWRRVVAPKKNENRAVYTGLQSGKQSTGTKMTILTQTQFIINTNTILNVEYVCSNKTWKIRNVCVIILGTLYLSLPLTRLKIRVYTVYVFLPLFCTVCVCCVYCTVLASVNNAVIFLFYSLLNLKVKILSHTSIWKHLFLILLGSLTQLICSHALFQIYNLIDC